MFCAMSDIVWVLQINHRHGTDTFVHRTAEGANDELFDYVKMWWSEAVSRYGELPEAMPQDRDEAVNEYFESMQDVESYTLEQSSVGN